LNALHNKYTLIAIEMQQNNNNNPEARLFIKYAIC
jgi:hypothetical protein